jgi:hypothetical protein
MHSSIAKIFDPKPQILQDRQRGLKRILVRKIVALLGNCSVRMAVFQHDPTRHRNKKARYSPQQRRLSHPVGSSHDKRFPARYRKSELRENLASTPRAGETIREEAHAGSLRQACGETDTIFGYGFNRRHGLALFTTLVDVAERHKSSYKPDIQPQPATARVYHALEDKNLTSVADQSTDLGLLAR